MNIEDFKRKQAELAAEIAEHGKTALLEGFKALFGKYPRLNAVRWTQYTPYFNDGDACTFSVYDFSFAIEGVDGDDDDGFLDYYSDWRMTDEQKEATAADRALFADIGKSSGNLGGRALESVYLAAFGDGSRITVRRDLTVEIEEYEHD